MTPSSTKSESTDEKTLDIKLEQLNRISTKLAKNGAQSNNTVSNEQVNRAPGINRPTNVYANQSKN